MMEESIRGVAIVSSAVAAVALLVWNQSDGRFDKRSGDAIFSEAVAVREKQESSSIRGEDNWRASEMNSSERGGAEQNIATGEISIRPEEEIESRILQRLAQEPGLALTTLNVGCDTNTCEIVFTGEELNAPYIGEERSELFDLLNRPWEKIRVPHSALRVRETSPGVKQFSIELHYVRS